MHLTKGASTKPRVLYCSPKQIGLATLLVVLLIAVRGPLVTTTTLLPGPLITRLPLEISPLATLSKLTYTPNEVTQHLALPLC